MNHLDYNYEQHYYPIGFLAVNATTPNPAEHIKFLCSVWNNNTNVWIDVHYHLTLKPVFILVSSEETNSITRIKMDEIYSKLEANFRIRVTLEFERKTGEELEKYAPYPTMSASEINKKYLTNMTLKKLQETKLMIIDELSMTDSEFEKECNFLGNISNPGLIKLNPIFQSQFPSSPLPVPINSKITWNVKDYIPFDTFTILNNLTRDYAYN